jgi:hypothetical protein
MGQQINKITKRRRRADYLKRKKEQAKLGGIVKKSVAKKETSAKKEPAKKVATKKVAAKKVPAKKAPAKKVAKKVADETAQAPQSEAAE